MPMRIVVVIVDSGLRAVGGAAMLLFEAAAEMLMSGGPWLRLPRRTAAMSANRQ